MQHRLLFLCSGNYYRSRFAEILFNHLAAAGGLPWRADSAALDLKRGGDNVGAMSHAASRDLALRGISAGADGRFPRAVTEEDFASADLVIAVKEAEHRPILEKRFAAWADRTEYWGIHDLDCATPVQALPELAQKVEQLVQRLDDPLGMR